MLKRRHIHAVLIVLLAFLGLAQAQQAAPAQPKPRRFLMWKSTSPSATIYLVGSIHVGDSSMYPLPKEVESAFATAKVLAVEINIKNADQAKMIGLVQKYGVYTDDDSLAKHLSKETQAALDDYCTRHNVPRMGMEKLKPWLVAISIAQMAWGLTCTSWMKASRRSGSMNSKPSNRSSQSLLKLRKRNSRACWHRS
jgi:uncharacterized protein YbaP (TraB family)